MATQPDIVFGGDFDADVRRRHRADRAITITLTLVMAAIAALLFWILGYVVLQGIGAINWSFLTDTPPGNPSDSGGGFANGIVGTFIIVGLATLLAVPLGIAGAIYLHQFGSGRLGSALRLCTDVMLGIPTIVTGAFVYALWVIKFGFSGYAGAIALGLVMVPLITRATEEMLRLVPRDLSEASLALGVTRSRTVFSILLPTARAGIITGVMLAVARAMGETAPLLLTALGNDLFMQTDPGQRMSTLSLQIFGSATGGFAAQQERAWAGALLLIATVLLLTIIARLVTRNATVRR